MAEEPKYPIRNVQETEDNTENGEAMTPSSIELLEKGFGKGTCDRVRLVSKRVSFKSLCAMN